MTNQKTMIKFFRKIRQKLLSENKFSKYLIYAIGEIILVVIGILIALQINNWNEGEKLKKEEIKILQNFEKSLNEDLTRTEWVTEQYLLTKNSISILINHLEQNLPYNDSLNTHFGRITQTWTPRINTEVFETLKSINLNLISKENLRNEIVQYYSYSNNILNNDIDRYVNTIENASKNIFNTRFNALWNGNYVKWEMTENVEDLELEMIPNNFDELKNDKEFLYFLRSLKNIFYWHIERNQLKIKRDAESLIQNINAELENKQN